MNDTNYILVVAIHVEVGESSPVPIPLESYKTRYGSDAQNILPPDDGEGVGGGERADPSAPSFADKVDLERRVRLCEGQGHLMVIGRKLTVNCAALFRVPVGRFV